jgi:hypothetical protein
MRKLIALCFISSLLAAGLSASASAADGPRRDILGLRVGMTKEAARGQLQKIGTLQREERKRQEVWEVRDDYFSHVIVGFDQQARVRFVTAVAREGGGQRMRYTEVASLKTARQEGDVSINNYHYVWELARRGKEPRLLVEARGRDPLYLSTYTIKKAE